ncbi:major facilitator superfamily domain-containing protein [Crucibulum laeve]|uniref:Major facilitator superfamily domain-containing protein n=1 Tax=Crucibulum laeve TaxID=68775 RepID=A0A5C3LKY5_9AGAR|nr:major facilitator superfamily domain-containing protein [Crucibulum laeve]
MYPSSCPTLQGNHDEEKGSTKEISSNAVDVSKGPTSLTPLRKILILSILCAAQFFDIFNAVASIVSLPQISEDLNFKPGTIQWILSGYTLTFASFMLVAGRIADILHPKPVFTAGFLVIGILSIPVGASVNPIMAVIFRALQGIGAAMNVPSAMALISLYFSEADQRSRAYAIYGASGAVGNVLGVVVGGVLTASASWRWVYYLLAIAMSPLAVASWFILPTHQTPPSTSRRSVDWPGVFSLTAGLTLFVFAITEGSAGGWKSARVIVTLVLSIVLLTTFLVIERIVKDPAFPTRTWSNKNFTPLFFYAWSIYWSIFVSEMQLVEIFSTLWHESALLSAVRCIPMGLTAVIASPLVGTYAPRLSRRFLLVGGQIISVAGVVLFALADTRDKYWSHIVPGMIVDMVGLSLSYVACTTVVMEGARPGEEGVVGAVMNTAYQIGATIGLTGEYHLDSGRWSGSNALVFFSRSVYYSCSQQQPAAGCIIPA